MRNGDGPGHVVMAWEQGAGLGHVGKLHVLAKAFVARGWRVTLVLRQLDAAQYFDWPDEVMLWQAPVWRPGLDEAVAKPSLQDLEDRLPSVNMSSLLLGCGWHEGPLLAARVQAWRTLLGQLRPTLLLADYAPVAMWMARVMSVPVVNVGVSISVPLCAEPMPALRWWRGPQLEQRRAHDDLLLDVVGQAAAAHHLLGWQRAAEAWRADLDVLCTLPALEFGAIQGQARECWGLLEQSSAGELPQWPPGTGPRVFFYLSSSRAKAFVPMMQALEHSGARILAVVPDALEAEQARWNTPRMRLRTRPLDMEATLSDAQLVVTQGSHGTMAQALCHGVPVLALPDHLEQTLNSMRLQKAGAGRLVLEQELEGAAAVELVSVLRDLLDQPRYRAAAMAVARQPLARLPVSAVAARLLDACEGWRRAC